MKPNEKTSSTGNEKDIKNGADIKDQAPASKSGKQKKQIPISSIS